MLRVCCFVLIMMAMHLPPPGIRTGPGPTGGARVLAGALRAHVQDQVARGPLRLSGRGGASLAPGAPLGPGECLPQGDGNVRRDASRSALEEAPGLDVVPGREDLLAPALVGRAAQRARALEAAGILADETLAQRQQVLELARLRVGADALPHRRARRPPPAPPGGPGKAKLPGVP